VYPCGICTAITCQRIDFSGAFPEPPMAGFWTSANRLALLATRFRAHPANGMCGIASVTTANYSDVKCFTCPHFRTRIFHQQILTNTITSASNALIPMRALLPDHGGLAPTSPAQQPIPYPHATWLR
jgi:hypothetical protein